MLTSPSLSLPTTLSIVTFNNGSSRGQIETLTTHILTLAAVLALMALQPLNFPQTPTSLLFLASPCSSVNLELTCKLLGVSAKPASGLMQGRRQSCPENLG